MRLDSLVATSGEDAEFASRPAISECRCARQANSRVFSMPVFTRNQGRAPTTADGLTVGDADMPENGELGVSRLRR